MHHLPTGTVTFLFTDIEGSTRLARALGDRWPDVLERHHQILRDAILSHNGVEIRTEGDAFFAVFPSAVEAIAATAAAQEALADHGWPEDAPVQVRMGLHTGEGRLSAGEYIGLDVHLAARVAATGHGGQVVFSPATHALVAGALPAGVTLRDLGEHTLKDFDEPIRLYQLGDRAFPPVRTIATTNLPRPASSFVGREREMAEVLSLVREGSRLVTLTGPGGTGKTRLALEAGSELVRDFLGGVFWVGLAPVRDPALVGQTIAQALGASVDPAAHIGDRDLLLVVDNFEQVVEAAREVGRLIQACPNLAMVVSSREVLRVTGEVEYPVLPLANDEAVELFRTRARLTESDGDVAELCARLDNLPLAVELAAARNRILTPRQMIERLAHPLDLLKGGRDSDPRQATLRATIAWSHDLLSEEEQRLFARLAVFTGGCTLEASEAVCDADLDTLQSLVEKSLLRRSGDRFVMLETIREFAFEQLAASGEVDEIRRRHFDFFAALAESANLASDAEGPMRHGILVPERANVRSAIEWAADGGDFEGALGLAVSLENLWISNNPFEGVRLFRGLLDRAEGVSDRVMVRALRCYGAAQLITGDADGAQEAFEAGLAIARRLGDPNAISVMLARLGYVALGRGDRRKAMSLLQEARELTTADHVTRLTPQLLRALGWLAYEEGDPETGVATLRQSVETSAQIGFTWWQAGALADLARVHLELGSFDEAETSAREIVKLAQGMNDRAHAVEALAMLASVAGRRGDAYRAGWLWGAIEAEEAKGPIGAISPPVSPWRGWKPERERYLAHVEAVTGPEFERGRGEGGVATLSEAMDVALREPE
jgi:predicted ATPase/class 3 adenylate cyclase